MYRLARDLLFRLDAEHAHELTIRAFRTVPKISTAPFHRARFNDPLEWKGLRFANRVGLAAGLDKNGECLRAWSRLGFGFVEIGTVTPRPQPGNPRPRMFRIPEHNALINRLGFNNKGVDYLLRQVQRAEFQGVLGINIGKNADTPIERAQEDYLTCLRKVHAHAGYITINISSPNTRNLRQLQDRDNISGLLSALEIERKRLSDTQGRRAPMVVKIAPDMDVDQLRTVASVVRDSGADGLIATNTTISRPLPEQHPVAKETGGLSGAPLKALADEALGTLRQELGEDFLLIGVGGIGSARDALDKRRLGADLVQVYTGFIYQGPRLISECAAALAETSNI